MKMVVDCVDCLFHRKELTDSDVEFLKAFLASKKVQDLRKIAVEVSVRLTGSVQKNDIRSGQVNRYGYDWSETQA